MHTTILAALLTLAPLIAHGGTGRCTIREDLALRRWVTECTDGARAITRYDAPLNRYRTDVITPPKGNKPQRGWPTPWKPPH